MRVDASETPLTNYSKRARCISPLIFVGHWHYYIRNTTVPLVLCAIALIINELNT